jgi:hypothetical protein
MGLEPLLQDMPLTDEQSNVRSQFFEATGYGPSDILSLNYSTREFLTKNGGHYRIVPDGIVHLAGPPPAVEDRWDF